MFIKKIAVFILILLCSEAVVAQCPQLYDFPAGVPSSNPYWISCSGTSYTLNISSPDNIGTWTIDWGDGSPPSGGASLVPPQVVPHLYPLTVDTFIVTFTETSTGCVITGVVVMEEPVNASIQIPIGGVTTACAPATLEFINTSTDVSPTTTFTWDFGDGSPNQVYDSANVGQSVFHTYLNGTVNCVTQVTLTAENYCSQGNPTVATFNPIQIYDIDNAQITPSNVLLCYPDTVVHYDNTTQKNCFPQGNTQQRYEYWNFGDYWGLGYDSIIPWQPYDPPPRPGYDIAYPGIGTYSVMLIDSSMCGLDTAYVTIQVIPPPVAGVSATPDTVCQGEAITFLNLSSGGANSFDWNFGDGSGWVTTGPGNQSHTYALSGSFTVTLVANISGGTASCTDTTTVDVYIRQGPQAGFGTNPSTGCDTLTVTFTDASFNAVAWSWDFGNSSTSTQQNPAPVFYNGTGNYTVWQIVTSNNGCKDSTSATVNVYQTPVPAFLPFSVCEGINSTFTDNSTSSPGDPIISWFWDFDDSGTSTNQNPQHTYIAQGSYNVALTVNTANCSATDTFPVTVEPKPVASFTMNTASGCTPLVVTFTNTSSGATNYNWDFGDGNNSTQSNPVHAFYNNGINDTTYYITLIASTAFGCSDTIMDSVRVFAAAQAQFTDNAVSGCAPMNVTFTDQSTGAVAWNWDFGDTTGSTLQNPTHLYQNQTLFITNYTVTLVVTSSNGCTDTATSVITVNPEPNYPFTLAPDSGCSPLTVSFLPINPGAVTFLWDFGDGSPNSTLQNPTHTFVNSTTNNQVLTITLIATNSFGCADTVTGDVVVFPKPGAAFTAAPATGCQPLDVVMTNNSTGATTFNWDYGDGNTSDTSAAIHNHIYSHNNPVTTNYTVTLIAISADGCSDTATQSVSVYPKIIAAFSAQPDSGCHPLNVSFSDQSTGAASWSWDFGDGSPVDVVPNPAHSFQNPGAFTQVFTVQLIVTSAEGCSDTATQNITVFPQPQASFTATPVSQVYPSTTVTFNNNTNPGFWMYSWDFGDGNYDTQQLPPDHSYATWGDYTILLLVTDSMGLCTDTVSQLVQIIPPVPVASFSGSGTGCRPLEVCFTNSSLYADTYLWDFGDGGSSNQQDPCYTYYNPGTYSVQLTAFGPGGQDATTQNGSVTVHDFAIAFFQANPTTVTIPNQPVQYYNLSTNASSWWWDFGDGGSSTDQFPEHYYTEQGIYDVTLVAQNDDNCPDTFVVENAVTAEAAGEIVVPNAFSPNTSGPNGGTYDRNSYDNDVFWPLADGVTDYHLEIFNRWGELIFESFDVNIGWDGYYRGELCQQDVYVWKITASFANGDTVEKAGDVTLLR